MPAALAGHKIDGYIVAEPFNAISEIKTGAKIMRFTGDIWKNHPCCVVVMNESITKSHPAFTQKVINAIVRAQLWLTDNLQSAARILSREGGNYLPLSEKILLKALTGYTIADYGSGNSPQAIRHPEWNNGRIGFQPWPYHSATSMIISQMGKTLVEGDSLFLRKLNPDSAARELVDDSFVRKALRQVGGREKFNFGNIDNPWEREEIISI
jgi:NitT/TauT family transport system substrate-binding protein